MKTNRHVTGIFLVALLIQIPLLTAQESNIKSYWIHEDRVKPAKLMEYEAVAKELIALCNEYKPQNGGWITLVTDDFRYSYISQMETMADLEKDPFAEMGEKVGKDKMADIWKRMDACYTDHIDYVLHLNTDLSYMPGGITQMPEGEMYRENSLYYVAPEHMSDAYKVAMEYKKLHEKKNSGMHYRVYTSGFGADGTYFLVAIAAKDPMHMGEKMMTTDELLGDEGKKLGMKMLGMISETKTMKGYMRPDLSYSDK